MDIQAHRERSRPRSSWAQLTTVPGPLDPVKAGSTCGPSTGPAGLLGTNRGRRQVIPGRAPANPGVAAGNVPESGGRAEDHARAGPQPPSASLLSYPGP